MFFYGFENAKKRPAAPSGPAVLVAHLSFWSKRWGAARDGFFERGMSACCPQQAVSQPPLVLLPVPPVPLLVVVGGQLGEHEG